MAYVVARKGGRFEIRESLHTAGGPRSRTLAGFRVLSDQTLAAAAQRAQRPFDRDAVIRSGRRAGARIQVPQTGADRARERFLAGSRRMATALARPAPSGGNTDPGIALLELLGFADTIRASQPPRPYEPLAFPPLMRVAERRATAAAAQRR
ncbi:MAG TPA: hypothetical protein VHU13_07885 [Solirubrobacteraceae bacterium]|nr:hypothetical protein [Solirubrobacteraceae bacterium]